MCSIKEIEQCLFHVPCLLSEEERQVLHRDKRKGVQRLLLKWERQEQKEMDLEGKYREMSTYECELRQQGMQLIAGVDEAGRGPLAGPVVAGAVILKRDSVLPGLNDSKQLSENIRERFYNEIMAASEAVGVGVVDVKEIDRLNIYHASKDAMVKAIKALKVMPDHILVDAMELPIPVSQTSLIKGDSRSVSVAAGSIIAKVTRDRLMRELDGKYPEYGFSRHFGYATAEHLQNLKRHGVCDEHRRSFAPVRGLVI